MTDFMRVSLLMPVLREAGWSQRLRLIQTARAVYANILRIWIIFIHIVRNMNELQAYQTALEARRMPVRRRSLCRDLIVEACRIVRCDNQDATPKGLATGLLFGSHPLGIGQAQSERRQNLEFRAFFCAI